MTATAREIQAKINSIVKQDPRYHSEAYWVVFSGLDRAFRQIKTARHMTGAELLAGIREVLVEQYGPMASTVLEHWGVKNSLDFGHIVFKMVHEGLLSKTEKDRLEDFQDDGFFAGIFDESSSYRLHQPAEKGPKKKPLAKNKLS